MSGKYRGFFDILTGFLVGAGSVKIYYESHDENSGKESFIFRQNQRKIEKICTTHENLRFGRAQRIIDMRVSGNEAVNTTADSVFPYGIPERQPDMLYYKGHILAYDSAKKVPYWVAEHLTAEKNDYGRSEDEKAERTRSHFRPDPNIPDLFQATNEDYFKSGWARGHMAPAGDNKHDQESMDETFLLSNIIPQNFDNNANYWYRLEAFCRSLVKKFKDVYVISGPVWLPHEEDSKKIVKYEVIGENNIAVPTHLFKIILTVDHEDKLSLATFQIPNAPIPFDKDLTDFLVPLSKLEKDSGFRFFKNLQKANTKSLCKTTSCKLLTKDMMENVAVVRKLNACKCTEELERIWENVKNKEDNFAVSVYKKKREELAGKVENSEK